jgi:DNA-directed RNA polymerase specialized sigma24 family protein
MFNPEIEVIGPVGEELIQELYDASLNAIQNLKEPYKTVMIEREVNKKQLHIIANELGWNTSTVKTRLRKARKDIADDITKKYPELVEAFIEIE